MTAPGSLTCVGLGMLLGGHLSPRARSHIEGDDCVFAAVSDPLVELWLQRLRPDLRSLQPLYGGGRTRHQTYRAMVDQLLAEVRGGARVCGVFYGHPGVFAQAPHEAIAQARREGYAARMEPGISAEDCLYADLGIDPGRYGCQHFEATQLLIYHRRIDPAAYLVLWQVGLVGDRSYRRRSTGAEHRRLLVERLAQEYPRDHPVIVYEAATLPIASVRADTVALHALPEAVLSMHSTLVVPPCRALQPDQAMLERLAQIERAHAQSTAIHPPKEESDDVRSHPAA